MALEIKSITIPKEKAIFWMDKNGVWHNEHGRFEHPKLIAYFNSSIRKDHMGYHLYQLTDEFEEKVYFFHEDTALFVVDLTVSDVVRLALNNRTRLTLQPDKLYSSNDALYLETQEHIIKFTDRALVKLSKFMQDQEGELFLVLNDQSWPIVEKMSSKN
ncbi:MAG: MFS transporter permease [Desulfobacterium sp.]|nr:MFS transporter permease [Desulfobacterium sp.]